MMIGKGGEEVASAALIAGIDDYQRKEVEVSHYQVLVKRIRMAVEKKRARTESEERLRAIFAASPDVILVSNLEGTIVDCNQAMLDLKYNDSKEEIIGRNAFDFIAEKDHKRVFEDFANVMEEGSKKNLVYTFITGEGRELLIKLSVSVIKDTEGNPKGFVAITKHIIERRQILDENRANIDSLAKKADEDSWLQLENKEIPGALSK